MYYLMFRIHDVYNNRILQVLSSMQLVTLHTLPEDGSTWSAEEFLDKIDEICRQASIVCDCHTYLSLRYQLISVLFYNCIGIESKEYFSRRSSRRSIKSCSKGQ